mgnify:CR=1 FL=1
MLTVVGKEELLVVQQRSSGAALPATPSASVTDHHALSLAVLRRQRCRVNLALHRNLLRLVNQPRLCFWNARRTVTPYIICKDDF